LQNDDVMDEWMETQSNLNLAQSLEAEQHVEEAGGYEPTLFVLYQQYRQQQLQIQQQPLPPPPPAPQHVQLDILNQLDFDSFFTAGPSSISDSVQSRIGQHLRERVAATY
jgi:hypothetical protein